MNINILQSENQIVYNTFYFQKLLEIEEKEFNIPINEYLSRIIGYNLKSLVNIDYIKYKQKNDFLFDIDYIIETNNNCILDGFQVGVYEITDKKIKFQIFPGMAILDSYLIELNTLENLEVDIYDNVLIGLFPEDKYKFSIRTFALNNDLNLVDKTDWDEKKILPIGIFKIIYNSFDIKTLSLESLGTPILLNNSYIYYFVDIDYVDLKKNKKNISTKSLVNIWKSYPKIYKINGHKFIIPNYSKMLNNVLLLDFFLKDVKEYERLKYYL